jgi:hypothetical protein
MTAPGRFDLFANDRLDNRNLRAYGQHQRSPAESLRGSREELWLEVVPASRGNGAGDGNRTQVSRTAPLAGSITYERQRFRV